MDPASSESDGHSPARQRLLSFQHSGANSQRALTDAAVCGQHSDFAALSDTPFAASRENNTADEVTASGEGRPLHHLNFNLAARCGISLDKYTVNVSQKCRDLLAQYEEPCLHH